MTKPRNPKLPPTKQTKKEPKNPEAQERIFQGRFKRTLRAIEAREEGTQELGFVSPEFSHCGIPLRRLKSSTYERKDGYLTLKMRGEEKYGLPYGQDRLFILFLITVFEAAGEPSDNRIYLRYCKDILEAFGIPVNGHEMQLLKERILRVCNTTFQVEEIHPETKRTHVKYRQMVDEFDLTFLHDDVRSRRTKWQNVIELNWRFADALRRQKMPIDFDTIKALKEFPAAVDLYLFEARRSYQLAKQRKAESHVPVFEEGGLKEQLATTIKDGWRLKQQLRRWHRLIVEKWKGCPNELTEDGKTLILRPAQAVNPNSKLALKAIVRSSATLPPEYRPPEEELLDWLEEESPEPTPGGRSGPQIHFVRTEGEDPDGEDEPGGGKPKGKAPSPRAPRKRGR